jgi:hypothetical protein
MDYRRELSQNIKHISEVSHKIEVFNPRCVVIAGNYEKELNDSLKLKSFELFRSSLRDLDIITYDELFRKAELLAKLFNLKPIRRSEE